VGSNPPNLYHPLIVVSKIDAGKLIYSPKLVLFKRLSTVVVKTAVFATLALIVEATISNIPLFRWSCITICDTRPTIIITGTFRIVRLSLRFLLSSDM
jgi:hypothetical protein